MTGPDSKGTIQGPSHSRLEKIHGMWKITTYNGGQAEKRLEGDERQVMAIMTFTLSRAMQTVF